MIHMRTGILLVGMVSIATLAAEPAEQTEKQRLELHGRLMLDGDRYGAFWSKQGDDATSDAEVRSGRLELEYDFPKGWIGKVQIEATLHNGNSDVDVGTAYLRYTKWDFAEITVGKTKEPVGLERNTSAEALMTIERSMVSAALTPSKNWGLHLEGGGKQLLWAVAVITEDDQDNRIEGDEPGALSARAIWSPLHKEQGSWQLGGSISLRDWKENIFQIRERAEVSTADRVVRSAEFRADRQSSFGLEGVWRQGSWLLQGEYVASRVEEVAGHDWHFSGYYLTGSYFLGGEQHAFRSGKMRSHKATRARGAWELVARYSHLDARDHGLGSIASITTLGANYYWGERVKVMVAFLNPDISGSVWHLEPNGNTVSMRLQYAF